jgi:hypothetical protein
MPTPARRFRRLHRSLVSSLAATALLLAFPAAGAEPGKKGAPKPPDEKAAMEAMTKAATPGEAHQRLGALVGNFDAVVKTWMDPSKPAEESKGTSENRWVLGSRYVEQRYQGSFMGQPFNGIGFTGYDNTMKKYVGVWMDDASTALMYSTGRSSSPKVMDMTSTMLDPTTGKPTKITEKLTVVDGDHHTMEMWAPGPNGKTYKMMEITYVRAAPPKK